MKAGVSQQAARAAGFLGSRMWFLSKTWLLWSSVANACSLTWTWGDEHCGSSSWRHTVYKIPSYLPPNLLPVRALEVSPRCYPHLIAEDTHILFTEKKGKKKALAPAPPTFTLLLSGYSPTLRNTLTRSLQSDPIPAAFPRRSASNHYRKRLPISHCWCNIFIHSSSQHQFQAHWPGSQVSWHIAPILTFQLKLSCLPCLRHYRQILYHLSHQGSPSFVLVLQFPSLFLFYKLFPFPSGF